MNIAIFEQERLLSDSVFRSLSSAGYTCQVFRSRERLLEALEVVSFDILILGIQTRASGISVLIRKAREKTKISVLILAQSAQKAALCEGLAAGAEDYICLPVRQEELQLRISIISRKILPDAQAHQHLQYGDFIFEKHPNKLIYKGSVLKLTAKEFELALLFFRHFGMPLSRAYIADAIWKMDGNDMARTTDTHVSRVRNKLNLKPQNGFLLEQIYGFGYQLVALP